MDKQQKESIVRHISQKIFINKVSQLDLNQKFVFETKFDELFDFAYHAAQTYVEDLELEIEQDKEDEADLLT